MIKTDYETDTDDECSISDYSITSVLMDKICSFYNNKEVIDIFLSVINGKTNISLRIIDFFVTNYAKKREVIYDIKPEKDYMIETDKFMVYYSYKSQLKGYSKQRFDPFCRRSRIKFIVNQINDNEVIKPYATITTTVGQLNFFKWAIQYNVLNYMSDNLNIIEKSMNQSSKKCKKKKVIRNKDLIDAIVSDTVSETDSEHHINPQQYILNNKLIQHVSEHIMNSASKLYKINEQSKNQNEQSKNQNKPDKKIKLNNKNNQSLYSENDELSNYIQPVKTVNKHNVTITVKFN
jgi:hypothetical protein